eukprot:TRINITY_DN7446_c0_g1_i1.p1 TRINITY_DN7446_c0_g1~~TRINITY_DN7446_c0_g1_i1.p1  ORF type:complete len:387 (+),score=74.83 TRINITY_DN7446_c0_g1_i1:500-1660(+)
MLLNRCQRAFTEKQVLPVLDKSITKPEERMELENRIAKIKSHNKGNITFIGELYKQGMLTEKIMHQCLLQLISDPTKEDDLEHFCKLLSTIGGQLERNTANKEQNQYYFQEIDRLSKDNRISHRIRFTLQELIELRANKWVQRKAGDATKTIKKGISAKEKHEPETPPAAAKGHKSKKPYPQKSLSLSKTEDDGWNTVPSVKQGKSARIAGRKGAPPKAAAGSERENYTNKFGMLSKSEAKKEPPKPVEVVASVESIVKPILDEMIASTDIEEAVDLFKDVGKPELNAKMIEFCVVYSLEKKDAARTLIQELFKELHKSKIFQTDHLERGFALVLVSLPELSMDVPLSWRHLADYISYALLEGSITPQFLSVNVKKLSEKNASPNF